MIDDSTRAALFRELHASIEETAVAAASIPGDNAASEFHPTYPPGAKLSPAEADALRCLDLPPPAREALRKPIADACSRPLFELFSLLDGAADPVDLEGEDWLGLSLEPRRESDEVMLHDEFFESYGNYSGRSARPNKALELTGRRPPGWDGQHAGRPSVGSGSFTGGRQLKCPVL